jgi:ABC-2 type transport system ATP-binding protein
VLQTVRNPTRFDQPALSVAGATHSYGTRSVLDGVSLTVKRGELYSLLGANGAGKSTLLRAIAGRIVLDGGDIRIAGQLSAQQAAARRLTGYVPQDVALYAHLTVSENLAFFAAMFGLRKEARVKAVRETLIKAGLEDRADQITGTLSGGYQRRVNIAVAALNMPSLIVLDEPTVGIDVHAREAIHALLRTLQDGGAAIVLTTHDLDQAQLLSDRVGMLQAGKLVIEGEPEQLLRAAFRDRKETVLELKQPADSRDEAFLRGLHLAPLEHRSQWGTHMTPDHLDVTAFTEYLEKNGIEVKEVRVRKPDLASLFMKIMAEGGAS